MKWYLFDQPQEVLRDSETSMLMIDSSAVYFGWVISASKCWIVGVLGSIHRSALGFVAFGGPEAKSCPCFAAAVPKFLPTFRVFPNPSPASEPNILLEMFYRNKVWAPDFGIGRETEFSIALRLTYI